MKNLGKVNPESRGFQELFETEEGFIVVSTVGDVREGLGPDNKAIVDMAGMFGGMATSGEETMAFASDKDGKVTDWGEIAVTHGPDSRKRLIEELENGQ